MTDQIPMPASRSRRAILAGALGGLGALAAGAIGRPHVAQGHDADDVLLGGGNSASSVTTITNSSTNLTVLSLANTHDGVALESHSAGNLGVSGTSNTHTGLYGFTTASNHAATVGFGFGNSTGVLGYSGSVGLPAAKPKTGVYGYANQDGTSKGVFGESNNGFAGYFAGKVYTSKFHEMAEITAPTAPGANKGRLFMRDNGSGKTQLCVRFNTGGVLVIATQP